MMQSAFCYGADVGKACIVTARDGEARLVELANEPAAIDQWLSSLPPKASLAMEATGVYHLLLAELAHARGVAVYVINPQHLKHYARAIGARAKTDRVDARLVARYLAAEHRRLLPWLPSPAANRRLAELLSRRAALVRARASIELSLSTLPVLQHERQALLGQCAQMLRSLEQLILKTLHEDPALAPLYARLRTIAGVGPILAAQLTEVLSRLRFQCADAFVAYCGLDPRPDDSGQRRGRRRLSKHGSAALRQLLWMAGLATSHTKHWRARYQGLKARGLSGTEAALIMGRKIARIAYAIARSGQPFNPAKIADAA